MTARLEVVGSMMCLRWRYFTSCDEKQDSGEGTLGEGGKLRRLRFLASNCTLSPNGTVKEVLEKITNTTFEECSMGLYTGNDTDQRYAAAISAMTTCLMKDFIDNSTSGTEVNFSKLKKAIKDEKKGDNAEAAGLLLEMVKHCKMLKAEGAEDFAYCWLQKGVVECAYEEAIQAAMLFPNTCDSSVP